MDSRKSEAKRLFKIGWSKTQIRRELKMSSKTLDNMLKGDTRGKPYG